MGAFPPYQKIPNRFSREKKGVSMNVLILSIVWVLGQTMQPGQPGTPAGSVEAQPSETACEACPSYCCPAYTIRGGVKSLCGLAWDWLGPMPQTCYQPRFGCYPGNARDIHRYPAFHGYYYRQPYNYRHYFEYPWHAQPHEPLGYFTYPSGGEIAPEPAAPIEAPSVPSEPSGAKPSVSSTRTTFPATPQPLPAATLSSPWQPIKPMPIR